MKKFIYLPLLLLTLLLASCGSGLFDKTAQAYEDATKELENATTNEDCDRIHDDLMQKLYDITKEYPDWKEIIQKEGEDGAGVKKVTEAYKAWNDALQKATKDNHYMFMTFCNFENAIEQFEGKSSSASETKESTEESSTDEMSSTDTADGDFDQLLASYEEFCNDYIDMMKKASEGDLDAAAQYPELLKKAEELGNKMEKAQGDATPEQWQKFLEIQKKLLNAAQEIN